MRAAADRYASSSAGDSVERAGLIVEAAARIVRRQELRGVELHERAGRARRSRTPCGSCDAASAPAGSASPGRRSCSSSVVANACTVAKSGRGSPAGGIMPARTFFSIFSATAASSCALPGRTPRTRARPRSRCSCGTRGSTCRAARAARRAVIGGAARGASPAGISASGRSVSRGCQ